MSDVDLEYGFRWGQVDVERVADIRGQKILHIKTKQYSLQVRVTKTGIIRVDGIIERTTEE